MKKLYVWERTYPHVIALIITSVLTCLSFIPINSSNVDSLIDGIITLDSIIIGFLGTIIPIILSMKNESKLVRYVFDRDSDGLFKKYILETVGYGFLDVCISLTIYLRDIVVCEKIIKIISFVFIYMFLLFILATYRSMSCMLKLLFTDDRTIQEPVSEKLEKNESDELWNKKGK